MATLGARSGYTAITKYLVSWQVQQHDRILYVGLLPHSQSHVELALSPPAWHETNCLAAYMACHRNAAEHYAQRYPPIPSLLFIHLLERVPLTPPLHLSHSF